MKKDLVIIFILMFNNISGQSIMNLNVTVWCVIENNFFKIMMFKKNSISDGFFSWSDTVCFFLKKIYDCLWLRCKYTLYLYLFGQWKAKYCSARCVGFKIMPQNWSTKK